MLKDYAEQHVRLNDFPKIALLHHMQLQEHPYKLSIRR